MRRTLRIVLGDLVLMSIALVGVAAVTQALGPWYGVLNLLAAAYLAWMGVKLWRAAGAGAAPEAAPTSLAGSLAAQPV